MLIFQEAAVTNASSSPASGTPHGPWVQFFQIYCFFLAGKERWTLSDVIVQRDLVRFLRSFQRRD